MRSVIVFAFILLGANLARAQEQEKKLLDRLLKPDTTLQNDAQGKQFSPGGRAIAKNARTKSFHVTERKAEKGFWNTRRYAAREFPTDASRFSQMQANTTPRFKLAKMDESYAVGGYRDVHPAADAQKSLATADYPGNRAFVAQGKSQKTLSAQKNAPMSIEQVRELLNKNK